MKGPALLFLALQATLSGGMLRPQRSVILTKVRIQGNERRTPWLWILTFVRMTGARGKAA